MIDAQRFGLTAEAEEDLSPFGVTSPYTTPMRQKLFGFDKAGM